MKESANSFVITGFIAVDPTVKQLATSNVAKFPVSLGRKEVVNGVEKKSSTLLNFETYRKGENPDFSDLKKGRRVTLKGFMKPESWTDNKGNRHDKLVFVATEITDPVSDKSE